MAAQWADGIWPLFVLLGLEHVEIRPGITAVTPLDFVSYPYSHSLCRPRLGGAVRAGLRHAAQGLARRAVARRARAVALGARCRRASAGHADVAGWPEARRGPVEFAAGDAGRGIRAVRRRRLALHPRDRRRANAWARAAVGVRHHARGHLLAAVFGPPPPSERVLAISASRLAVRRVGLLDRPSSRRRSRPPMHRGLARAA